LTVAESVRRDHAGRTVYSLRGDHDASTAAALSSDLARVMTEDDTDVVLDLSEVNFMGASTVGIIVNARAFLEQQHRRLIVQLPTPCARRVLEICGLADLTAV
jgi:anti-anti-sigma factor